MRAEHGFTLIELIAVAVLLGFVAVFAGLFVSTGARGTLAARQAEENAQKGQIALARIVLELRDASGGPASGAPQVSATSIQYTSSQASLPGARTLAFDAGGARLTLTPDSGGTAQTLVDGVTACTMGFSGTGAERNVVFTVSFTLNGMGQPFSITVKPRNAISTPVGS